MIVELTQFMRPDGRQVASSCDVSEELKEQYQQLRSLGCRLTCEVLQTSDISLAIEHEEGDYAIELCENAPDKPKAALEKLLRRFKPEEFREWLKEIEEEEL